MNKELLIQGLEMVLKTLKEECKPEPKTKEFKPTHRYVGRQGARHNHLCTAIYSEEVKLYCLTFENGLNVYTSKDFIKEFHLSSNTDESVFNATHIYLGRLKGKFAEKCTVKTLRCGGVDTYVTTFKDGTSIESSWRDLIVFPLKAFEDY